MKIQIEDYELIYSKVIIQIKNYPIRVTLPDEIEGDYTFIFNFAENENEQGIVTNFNAIDKYNLEVTFVNFEKGPTVGNNELIEVGTIKKFPLFLSYRVDNLNNAGKTLTINFYIRKERENAK